jgi:hypothetical protein
LNWFSGLCVVLLVATLPTDASGRAKFELAHTHDLTQDGLRLAEQAVVVDRGKMLFIGTSERSAKPRAQVLRLRDYKRLGVTFPRGGSNRGDAQRNQRHDLAFFDNLSSRAGWFVTSSKSRQQRVQFVDVDVRNRRIMATEEVSRNDQTAQPSEIRPLGFSPHSGDFHFTWRGYAEGASKPYGVELLRFDRNSRLHVIKTVHTAKRIHGIYYDRSGARALLAEYGAHPRKGAAPRGHLVSLRTGDLTSFPIPPTAYGFEFDEDGQTVYAYSSQLGQVWTIDVERGQRVAKHRAGNLGHAFGRVLPGMLLLIRDHGLELLDQRTRRRTGYLPMKKLGSSYALTEGSLVVAGQAIVRNGDALHFVRVTDTAVEKAE